MRRSLPFMLFLTMLTIGACSADPEGDETTPDMTLPRPDAGDVRDLTVSDMTTTLPDDLGAPDLGVIDSGAEDLTETDLATPPDLGVADMTPDLVADMLEDLGPPPPSCDDADALHLAPEAVGDGDGRAPEHAAPVSELNALIMTHGGSRLYCLEAGDYGTGLKLSRSGTPEEPVVIRANGDAVFRHTFVANATNKFGATAIELTASHITLEGLRCERVGQCISFPSKPNLFIEGVRLRDLEIVHVGTGISVERGGEQVVRDLLIQGVMIRQFSRAGIFLAATMERVTVAQSYLDMQPEQIGGRGSDYVVGIVFADALDGVEVVETTVLNVLGKDTGYTQGDGIDGESTSRNIQIRDAFFAGHRDGCIDTKTRETVIRDTVVLGCKRNLRLWQNAEGDGPRVEHVVSYQPREAHLFTKGPTPARFEHFEVRSDNMAKLLVLDGEGSVQIGTLSGTLAQEDRRNVPMSAVQDDQLIYGEAVMTPVAPNPTRFMP